MIKNHDNLKNDDSSFFVFYIKVYTCASKLLCFKRFSFFPCKGLIYDCYRFFHNSINIVMVCNRHCYSITLSNGPMHCCFTTSYFLLAFHHFIFFIDHANCHYSNFFYFSFSLLCRIQK